MLRKALGTTLLLLLVISCGSRPVGYGVVYWAPVESVFATGEVVPILKESQISDSFTILDKVNKAEEVFPRWRILSFQQETEAVEFSGSYEPWRETYAYSERRNLPVREENHQKAQTLAKLQENQVVKVLGRDSEKSQEGEYENYWYQVLTEEGTRGFCFGEYLVLFETGNDPLQTAQELQARDALLESVLNRTWRPEYYKDMISNGRIDFSRLVSSIGFFPAPEEKRLKLVTEGGTSEYVYNTIRKIGDGFYFFDGADVRMRVMQTNRIILSYSSEGKSISEAYVFLGREVSSIISEEKERREALFGDFIDRDFVSRAYGTITFVEGMKFSWEGFEKLLPFLSGKAIRRIGRVGFPLYLGKALSSEFDGVISLYFETVVPGGEERVDFLYRFTGSGVGFTLISPPDSLTIEEKGVSPLVLFFSTE